jgi:hypothetical protein
MVNINYIGTDVVDKLPNAASFPGHRLYCDYSYHGCCCCCCGRVLEGEGSTVGSLATPKELIELPATLLLDCMAITLDCPGALAYVLPGILA